MKASQIRSPLQGSGLRAVKTQGVALGCDRPRRWRFHSSAPKGHSIVAQGNALGNLATIREALKGRLNSQRMEVAP